MFGIGGSAMIIILIVALLFLGPDKLPGAAKTISKGIRDLKRGSREIQQTIENDETIGGAIRDLKSALRGEDPPPRRKPKPKNQPIEIEADEPEVLDPPKAALQLPNTIHDPAAPVEAAPAPNPAQLELGLATEPAAPPVVKLPAQAGEADPDHREGEHDREELAARIKPAAGTVAKTDG